MAETKVCRTCGQEKPISAFYVSRILKSSRRSYKPDCLSCEIAAGRTARFREKQRTTAARAAKAALLAQGKKVCAKCGKTKTVDEFFKSAKAKDGRQGRCRICVAEDRRERRARDPETARAKQRAEYYRNPDRCRSYTIRRYHGTLKFDLAYIEAARLRAGQHYKDKPFLHKASVHRRRLLITLSPSHFTAEDLAEIVRLQRGKCAICRKPMRGDVSADHIIAVSKGGSNARSNIQATHLRCNRSKKAKDPILHMRSLGFPL